MTQSTYSNATDSHEVEPRLVFENLPPDVRHRVSQLMQAAVAAEQLVVPKDQPAPEPYKTPVPFNIEAALAAAEAAAAQPKPEMPVTPPQTEEPTEQAPIIKDRKMAIQSQGEPSSALEELRRQVWNAYDDEPQVSNIFFPDERAA